MNKRLFKQTIKFSKIIDKLFAERKASEEDFKELKNKLLENPDWGDLIPKTGGVRKTRLKSLTKGTRGGFRVCYYDDPFKEELFFIIIYPKNERENLSNEEIKALKQLTMIIKSR
jgi:hypothetical protein